VTRLKAGSGICCLHKTAMLFSPASRTD
jgi:hypothetical protein